MKFLKRNPAIFKCSCAEDEIYQYLLSFSQRLTPIWMCVFCEIFDCSTALFSRILELQERVARKRLMNQQLASQINAATTAKQAQLRAIQQQGGNHNKNSTSVTKNGKPVSTVEPFQRGDRDYQTPPGGEHDINALGGPQGQQQQINSNGGGKINKNVKFATQVSNAAR